ncbi:glycosyltransferase family 2 protein [Shewanella algae]
MESRGLTNFVPGLVSIVMPCFNGANTIKDAIESVILQSYSNWELLITDDSSTDSSRDIIESFDDPRIVLLKNTGPRGVANARNFSIERAKGEFIAFLDCDDMWFSSKLFLQLEALKQYDFNVCHSSYVRFKDGGEELGIVKSKGLVTFKDMLKGNKIGNLTGIYNCSLLGKFYQKQIGHEDYLMWLDILRKSNSIGLECSLASYRVSSKSLSSNKFRALVWHYKILHAELGFSIFHSSFLLLGYIWNGIVKRV